MAVPRNRASNARKKSKRAHMSRNKKNLSPCSSCGERVLSHRLCSSCGYYAKKLIVHEEKT